MTFLYFITCYKYSIRNFQKRFHQTVILTRKNYIFVCCVSLFLKYMPKLKNTQEMKYAWLSIKFSYCVLPASVGVSYVANQFHVSNSDGRMSQGVKTSQRCEWLIVTSRNVSSKINVKPSKVQIPISFLIIWIFWSNINEFTHHMMTCLKSQNLKMAKFTPTTHFPMARLIYMLTIKQIFMSESNELIWKKKLSHKSPMVKLLKHMLFRCKTKWPPGLK